MELVLPHMVATRVEARRLRYLGGGRPSLCPVHGGLPIHLRWLLINGSILGEGSIDSPKAKYH